MTNLDIRSKQDEPIRTFDDWRRFAPPKKDGQWRDGYSAAELARAWTAQSTVPPDVIRTLDTVPELTGFTPAGTANPEWVTSLPERGEGRNHDLVVTGVAAGGTTLLGVEGKCRETFDRLVSKVTAVPPPSRQPQRAEALAQALFGRRATDPAIGPLRYQLLTAAVGTALEANARKCDQAVLLIHELLPENGQDNATIANAADLTAFVAELGGGPGPFDLHPTDGIDAPVKLFVVKVESTCA